MIFSNLFSTAVLLALMLASVEAASKRSMIQMISDGFGPASETLARNYLHAQKNQTWDARLPLDKHLVGTIRTRSTDSLVTDSAASATAYSCGMKSVNGYIGVDIDQVPCGTVMEGAKAKGFHTALVTTSRITHATPASYSAHINDRDLENEIASQQLGGYVLGRQADILWGGGRRHFLPKSDKNSEREDDRNLIDEAAKAGWTIVQNKTQFDTFQMGQNVSFPSLGLFTNSHMAYEIDRDDSLEPSLTDMSITALTALKKADEPFFIMIEGARIDHAAHNNDPIGHIYDILEYNRAFEAVAKWVDENSSDDHEILLVSTSDHECGGLALSWQRPEDQTGDYAWYPDVMFNAKHSTEYLANQAQKDLVNKTESDMTQYMRDTIIKENLGIEDVSDDEVKRAVELVSVDDWVPLAIWLAGIVNWRAHLDWSSDGHSGVDVNLYVHSKDNNATIAQQFMGNHENTWIGNFTSSFLQLDLSSVSKKLNNDSNSVVPGQGSANHSTPTGQYEPGKVQRQVLPNPLKNGRRSLLSHLRFHD
ncbi:alkaline phosphatase [Malassezia pachydermatis]